MGRACRLPRVLGRPSYTRSVATFFREARSRQGHYRASSWFPPPRSQDSFHGCRSPRTAGTCPLFSSESSNRAPLLIFCGTPTSGLPCFLAKCALFRVLGRQGTERRSPPHFFGERVFRQPAPTLLCTSLAARSDQRAPWWRPRRVPSFPPARRPLRPAKRLYPFSP